MRNIEYLQPTWGSIRVHNHVEENSLHPSWYNGMSIKLKRTKDDEEYIVYTLTVLGIPTYRKYYFYRY